MAGLFGWVTTGVETVYGTLVARDRAVEITSESLNYNPTRKNAMGVHAGGMVPLASQRQTVAVDAAGDITMYVPTKEFGRWLTQTFGTVSSTTIAGTPNAYKHTFTQAELVGKSLSIQKGIKREGTTNTYDTYTYPGCKVTQLQLAIAAQDFLTATISINAQNMVNNQASDTPTYPAGRSAFSYANVGAALTIDSVAYAGVTGWDITIPNSLKVDDFFMGGGGLKNEPARDVFAQPTGTITAQYRDNTLLAKFLSGATAALVVTFQNNQINAVPAYEQLKITLPAIGINGDTPNIGGPGEVMLSIPYEVLDDGTNPPVKIEYTTTDATP